MPSTQRLGALCVLLLLSVCATHVTGAPCSSAGGETLEISGDEVPEAPRVSPTTKWEPLTNMLICEVTRLRDQQFVEDFGESVSNMTNYKDNTLELPYIGERDCSSSNFSKDNCLQRISRGLQEHAVYLQFVEREFPKSGKVPDIKFRTKILADYVMEVMKNPKRVQELDSNTREQLLGSLPSSSAWARKMTVHVLLRDFRTFLIQTFRALRHIELRSWKRPTMKRIHKLETSSIRPVVINPQ
ncbi:hypothetical protein AGOR_G00045580 [Albula goreensis]|uniref:Interleukin-6 n=1 Tax=Albula goreensis TaxID=1534307 RepID=A0A8T3E6Q5_9TELE|nr:hypothetical protein AGOR_G00045580 [Albula goreensis]